MIASESRPPTLRQVQHWMGSLIAHPQRLDDETPEVLLAVPPCGTLGERLQVHTGGYPARVHEALEETFPALAHVIGPGAFVSLTRRYVRTVLPRTYNLNDAGAQLPEFLRDDPLTESLSFLPDLARLEWMVARSFHARDTVPLDPAALASWSWEDWGRAVFRFQPSVALVRSQWPIREIWASRDAPIAEIDIDVRDRPDCVLVRRAGFEVQCESIGIAEAGALAALLDGQTLGVVSEQLRIEGRQPTEVSRWFARWIQNRMITRCYAEGG